MKQRLHQIFSTALIFPASLVLSHSLWAKLSYEWQMWASHAHAQRSFFMSQTEISDSHHVSTLFFPVHRIFCLQAADSLVNKGLGRLDLVKSFLPRNVWEWHLKMTLLACSYLAHYISPLFLAYPRINILIPC